MSNEEISRLLRNVAAAYSIKDEKKFRFQILAYQKAADSIEHMTADVNELYEKGKLKNVPSIGQSLQSHLEELLKTGKVTHFESILHDVPTAVFPLLDIASFGPKKAYRLVKEFGLTNPETVMQDVTKLATEGKIGQLAGFGEKSQSDIIQAITEYGRGKTKTARMVLPYANELAKQVIAYLKELKEVKEAHPLGSLRRKRDTIGDIDIAVSTNNPEAVLTHFTLYPGKKRVIEKGEKTSSILTSSDRQIDLMTHSPAGFGSLLQHFTGSKEHNIHLREYALSKGMSLNEYGIKLKSDKTEKVKLFETEEAFYKELGMDWIPPEIREDKGEIELALQHKLPKLVTLKDIKGDFHLHSSFPIEESHDPGQSSMEEMIEKALSLGYSYIGFSEHNPSQSKHTHSQTKALLEKRYKKIERLRLIYKNKIRIISLLEVDILPNGKLAVDDDSLSLLDGAIVSIHSVFTMDKEKMTERVLSGLSNKKAKILAHPTGRLLNQRQGFELNWEQVFTFSAKHHKALEINAWPLRLDLPSPLVQDAIASGVQFFIDTDSHHASQMDQMEYGVDVARKGWATKNEVINTWEYSKLKDWFDK